MIHAGDGDPLEYGFTDGADRRWIHVPWQGWREQRAIVFTPRRRWWQRRPNAARSAPSEPQADEHGFPSVPGAPRASQSPTGAHSDPHTTEETR